jgi:hypothetical protein
MVTPIIICKPNRGKHPENTPLAIPLARYCGLPWRRRKRRYRYRSWRFHAGRLGLPVEAFDLVSGSITVVMVGKVRIKSGQGQT